MVDPAITASVVGAILTCGAAGVAAVYAEAKETRRLCERNNKLLEGFEDTDAYDGVVEQVERHERALRESGLLTNSERRGGD